MSNIIYIADAFLTDIIGGGELNDDEMLKMLSLSGFNVIKKRSRAVTVDFINKHKNSFFIISNFIGLNLECREELLNLRYLIYEHDHKYVKNRNPALYKDYKVPQSEIVNYHFYKNAAAVLCQSTFHQNIIKNNLKIDNIISVGGNIWSLATLEKLKKYSKHRKNEICAVLDSRIAHKNTRGAIEHCKNNGLKYELVANPDYDQFLKSLSKFNKFVFLPKTPETLSRVVVEARMLGCKIITNGLVGATSEEWFKLKGEELIQHMIEKRNQILSIITSIINHRDDGKKVNPKVSIISTFYQAEEFLEGFMDDIVNQTMFPECELIIIDTGSPGNEQEMIKPYLSKYKNIVYHRCDKRLSPTQGFNIALKKSRAKYVTWAMLDDRKKRDSLQILFENLKKNPDIDLVYGDCLVTSESNQMFSTTNSEMILENSSLEFSPENMIKCLPGPMPMWTRRMMEYVGFLDEDNHNYADDWELWLRSVNAGFKFKKVNHTIGLYRSGGRSQAGNNMDQRKEEAKLFYKYSHLFGQNYAKYKPYFSQFIE